MIDVETYAAAKAYTDAHGGEGGTTNYNALDNKPQIAGTTLQGNKSLADLGIAGEDAVEDIYAVMGEMGAKNLISYPYSQTTKTENNVTFTDNGDGTVTVTTGTGGASAYTRFYLKLTSAVFNLPNGRYILSSDSSDSNVRVQVTVYNGSTPTEAVYNTRYGEIPFALGDSPARDRLGVEINIQSGTEVNNLLIKPMIRLASDTDDTYQQYAKTNKQLTDEIANKVDKVEGKGLSTNDYDNTEKGKVADNTSAIEATQSMIVDEYNEGNFAGGDYCKYQNKLYRCISPTSGAWDSSKWTEVTTMSEVERLTVVSSTQLRTGFYLQKQGNTRMLFFNGVARVGTIDTAFDSISQTGEQPPYFPIFGAGILVMDGSNNFPCTLVLNTIGNIEVYYKDGTGEYKAPVGKLVYGFLTWFV